MVAGLYLVILASRWLLVSVCCSPVPFWDDWLDTVHILRALHVGDAQWSDYFTKFNGHILMLERLLASMVFLANDHQWDAQVQTTFNALLGALSPAILFSALGFRAAKSTGETGGRPRPEPFALIGIVLLFVLPLLWYNSIWAFQSQIYFLIVCSLGGMSLVLEWKAVSVGWFLGLAILGLALFSVASGFLAAAAVAGAILIIALRERRWRLPEGLDFTFLAVTVIAVAGILSHREFGGQESEGSHGLGQWLVAYLHNLNWPWEVDTAPDAPVYYSLILNIPAPVLLIAWFLRAQWLPEDLLPAGKLRFILACTLWSLGQFLAIAIARGAPSWRHYDVHAVWIFINIVCLGILVRCALESSPHGAARAHWRGIAAGAVALFCGVLVAGISRQCAQAFVLIEYQRKNNHTREMDLREYLATGKPELLARGRYETPFTKLENPGKLLDDPKIREILPAVLRAPVPLRPLHNLNTSRAFLPGILPPGQAVPPGRIYWSSWRPFLAAGPPSLTGETGNGDWVLPATKFRYLEQTYIGEFHGGSPPSITSVPLIPSQAGARMADQGVSANGDLRVTLKGDSAPRILQVKESSASSWIALSEPVETGRFTVWTRRAREAYAQIMLLGVALLVWGYYQLATRRPALPEMGPPSASL